MKLKCSRYAQVYKLKASRRIVLDTVFMYVEVVKKRDTKGQNHLIL